MKHLLFIFFITAIVFFSCKKSDIQVPNSSLYQTWQSLDSSYNVRLTEDSLYYLYIPHYGGLPYYEGAIYKTDSIQIVDNLIIKEYRYKEPDTSFTFKISNDTLYLSQYRAPFKMITLIKE